MQGLFLKNSNNVCMCCVIVVVGGVRGYGKIRMLPDSLKKPGICQAQA